MCVSWAEQGEGEAGAESTNGRWRLVPSTILALVYQWLTISPQPLPPPSVPPPPPPNALPLPPPGGIKGRGGEGIGGKKIVLGLDVDKEDSRRGRGRVRGGGEGGR